MKPAKVACILGVFLLALSGGAAQTPRGEAKATTSMTVKGLAKPAEIVVDRWGIPHIFADSIEDLFFVQGFNAARDRLWQLDLWRRQGEGKLAEAFGPRFVEQDRAARLFLYRRDLAKEFVSYHPRAKEILSAFTRGINAYIELTRRHPELLPLEFKLTGATPGLWSPATPLIRIFGLTRNVGREVRLAQLVHAMGPEAAERLADFQPPTKIRVPPGLDLGLIDDRILTAYNMAQGGVTFKAEDLRASSSDHFELERLARQISVPPAFETDSTREPVFESNNWTMSGRLTATGKPILAGDPHRAQLVPSLRYIAHLVGPGWNVIGAGEPALPGISLGHNERLAWAITIFPFADEEDLFVYDTNPEHPSQYQYRGRWEEMRVVQDTVPVQGRPPATVTLQFTRYGPVLFADAAHHKAYALHATYLEHSGTAAYLASLRLDQARDWSEFVRGAEQHFTPSLNFVYADVDGRIGWFGGGLAPIRRSWNGLLPVPGDGSYEWDGFLGPSLLPRAENPKEGFFATANQYNLPDGYDYEFLSSREWSDPSRFLRISEILRAGRGLTTQDSMRLQHDEVSMPARELAPLLAHLTPADRELSAALDVLRKWDFVLSKDSIPATLFEVWASQLQKDVFALYVPENVRPAFGQGSRTVMLRLLRSPDRAFGPNPEAGRNALLLESLRQAVASLKRRLGPDMAGWAWGRLHHVYYESALGQATDPATRSLLDVGPLPIGGDGFTVHNTSYRESDFRQTGGATYRQVLDLSDWDRSFVLNSPGQSGDPNSSHYRDLFPLSVEGTYVPLLFSRSKIIDAAEHIIVLLPETAARGH